jgi:NTE family protein
VPDCARSKTALVLAGGGSFGAIQAGMLHSLTTHGIAADMVVGSSGSLNGAYYAGNPTLEGIERLETLWRSYNPITRPPIAVMLSNS